MGQQKRITYEHRFGPEHPQHAEIMAMIEAANTANAELSRIFYEARKQGNEYLKIQQKSNLCEDIGYEDVVTIADKASEDAIIPVLTQCRNIAVLSEESADEYHTQTQDGAERWLVDPLDGTFCFKNDIPDFSVTIAKQRLIDGQWHTEIGVVASPMHNEIYLADHEHAYLIQQNREKLLQVKGEAYAPFTGRLQDVLKDKRIETTIFSKDMPGWMQTRKAVLDRLGDASQHSYSSALMVSKIADGWLDGAILAADANEKPWDVDAAIHIADKAGAHVKRMEIEGEPVVIVANSPALAIALTQVLTEEHHRHLDKTGDAERQVVSR